MRPNDQWKDGPGRMEYPDTVMVKAIRRADSAPGISKEHIHISFDVFGSHIEIYWNLEDDEFTWRTQRNLSDEQKRYLKFLTKLFTFVSYKDLRPET